MTPAIRGAGTRVLWEDPGSAEWREGPSPGASVFSPVEWPIRPERPRGSHQLSPGWLQPSPHRGASTLVREHPTAMATPEGPSSRGSPSGAGMGWGGLGGSPPTFLSGHFSGNCPFYTGPPGWPPEVGRPPQNGSSPRAATPGIRGIAVSPERRAPSWACPETTKPGGPAQAPGKAVTHSG